MRPSPGFPMHAAPRRPAAGAVTLCVLLLCLAVTASWARSASPLTAALRDHAVIDDWFMTRSQAKGDWSPDPGDTVLDVVIDQAPQGTDDFVEIPLHLGSVTGNQWSVGGVEAHHPYAHHLRGGVKYSPSGGGQGVEYSTNKSTALSCE